MCLTVRFSGAGREGQNGLCLRPDMRALEFLFDGTELSFLEIWRWSSRISQGRSKHTTADGAVFSGSLMAVADFLADFRI